MHMKVLVAEDDPVTRRGLVEILEVEGFQPVAAADGLQAWDLFRQHQPDFVCLDVMMPGQSGIEICKKIRESKSDVPIVFITAKGEEIDKVVGLEIGADDYIVKPFGVKEVVARIRAVARRCLNHDVAEDKADVPTAAFTMGHLKVLPSELRAKFDGRSIDLSLREIKILSLLFRSAGQVVDRNALMRYAWDQDYLPTSRTLDQHISQLRKRVEVDAKRPQLIQTVHGVGYRYDPEAETT